MFRQMSSIILYDCDIITQLITIKSVVLADVHVTFS